MQRSSNKKGIMTLGEMLIDFIPEDKEGLLYQKCPGGAPANVAVGAARLGSKASFIGKVGDDLLGHYLRDTLIQHGVAVDQLVFGTEANTGIVFVTLDETGERSFHFFNRPSADRFLHSHEINAAAFASHKLFHFGTISMLQEPVRAATQTAIKLAKEHQNWISFDPNIRLNLWEDEAVLSQLILEMLTYTDILKVSEEEVLFITGEAQLEQGIKALKRMAAIPLILVTKGSQGSVAFFDDLRIEVPTISIHAVDTTGAGDAFTAGYLYYLDQHLDALNNLDEPFLNQLLRFANICGGLAASAKGAMTALPNLQQVESYLDTSR
jgi:fructokinase